MNAMSAAIGGPRTLSALNSQISLRSVDRTAICGGVISRRDRIREIEAEINFACETAAIGCVGHTETQAREDWDAGTWRRYLAEAVHQARLCSIELNTLRQEASHLERLVRVTAME